MTTRRRRAPKLTGTASKYALSSGVGLGRNQRVRSKGKGKAGGKWKHGFIPVNAAAAKLKRGLKKR